MATKGGRSVADWRRQIAEDQLRPQFTLKPPGGENGHWGVALRHFMVRGPKLIERRGPVKFYEVPTYGAQILRFPNPPEDSLWSLFKRDMCAGSIPRRRYSPPKRKARA